MFLSRGRPFLRKLILGKGDPKECKGLAQTLTGSMETNIDASDAVSSLVKEALMVFGFSPEGLKINSGSEAFVETCLRAVAPKTAFDYAHMMQALKNHSGIGHRQNTISPKVLKS